MKISFGTILSVVVIGFFLWLLLFPAVTDSGPDAAPKAHAKNDVTQLAMAIKAYEVEYGHLPGTNQGIIDRELMETLMGENDQLNPRKIVFFEVKKAKNGKGGYTEAGTYVDPWGNPYQIAFATGTNAFVTNAGTNHIEIPKRVAIWNDPREERVTSWWFWTKSTNRPKHYVTSWE